MSVLAGQHGTDRWVMTGALFLAGGCYLLTAAGLAGIRRFGRLLLIVTGVAVIGIATSPEPASGPTPRHLAWTVLGAVTITIWPAFVARRGSWRSRILSVNGSIAVTGVFVALLGWFFAEAVDGSMVGLAERVTTSVEALWPFVVALALRRNARGTGPDIGHQGGSALPARPWTAASDTPEGSRLFPRPWPQAPWAPHPHRHVRRWGGSDSFDQGDVRAAPGDPRERGIDPDG